MTTSRAAALLRASHPEPALAVTLLATALSVSVGARTGWVLAAFATGQLTTGWTNDWLDRDRDVASGRADKPVARGALPARVVGQAALVASLLCVPFSLAMGLRAGLAHLVAVASAAAYNLRLKATALSFLPYAVSFGLVPSVITLGVGAWAPWWATASGALLGVGAHLANALPDLEDDLRDGIRGLPHRLGRAASSALAAVLLLAATALLALGPGRPSVLAALTLTLAVAVTAAGLLRGRRPGSRDAFRAVLVVAALDVALLVARGADLVAG